jgi:hypothetical protein
VLVHIHDIPCACKYLHVVYTAPLVSLVRHCYVSNLYLALLMKHVNHGCTATLVTLIHRLSVLNT